MDINSKMAVFSIPEVLLSSGSKKMPVLGMGTAAHPPVGSETFKLAILHAIEIGYRHFDTASLYKTEEPLGEAVAEALRLGLIKSRGELFITSKLWCTDAHSEHVLPALQKTLKSLQLEYLDLYLIHWPLSLKPGKFEYPIKKEDILPMDFKSVWAAMEECQRLGLTKSIGVSNFSCKKLANLLHFAKIPPAVNQVCLRWAHEQGVVIVAKSFNKERMKENLEIFDWELSKEDSKKISEIPQIRGLPVDIFISENGPFKSLEELWDGEI
ncbi:hypothetical protein F0562_033389 [Nyssa sinensis]|uniref:NADP-dependent oxidoreductase domain-containing protein n=1 Tax=Nyssa sinensis TaxID=561372 RepID=A0A5J5AS40_9ASTE|nr:hypothetical protein F0562_033389 [Nyssa sinensis]